MEPKEPPLELREEEELCELLELLPPNEPNEPLPEEVDAAGAEVVLRLGKESWDDCLCVPVEEEDVAVFLPLLWELLRAVLD